MQLTEFYLVSITFKNKNIRIRIIQEYSVRLTPTSLTAYIEFKKYRTQNTIHIRSIFQPFKVRSKIRQVKDSSLQEITLK